MIDTLLGEEFQALSKMTNSFDDACSARDQLPTLMNKLRRKCTKYLRQPEDFTSEEAKQMVLSRPTNVDYYKPLKDLLLSLADQLTELFDDVTGEQESHELVSKINTDLDRLRPFINVMRLAPEIEESPCDPLAFSDARSRRLVSIYIFLLCHLSAQFKYYQEFIQRILIQPDLDAIDDEEWLEIRDRFDSEENGMFRIINMLFKTFDRPNMDILREDWNKIIHEFSVMIRMGVSLVDEPLIRYDPEATPTRKQYKAFFPIVKLCRLLMNKLSKFTNHLPHPDLRIPFNQMECFDRSMEYIISAMRTLDLAIDQPQNPETIRDAMEELAEHVGEVYGPMIDYFEELDPTLDNCYSLKMLDWCNNWKLCFHSAIGNYDLNFQGKNYRGKYFEQFYLH